MNDSVSRVCQQICGDALWDAHFLLSASVRSLLSGASATDDYHQFKLGHITLCVCVQQNQLPPPRTAQLNFHQHVAKQQRATKNVWDNFYVLPKSRISERSSVRCTLPFISLKAYSCQKIRTTLSDILSFLFLSGNTVCACMPTHTHTHTVHKFAAVSLYVT